MRKKNNVTGLVLKNTKNIFSSLSDLVLWNLFYLEEVSPFKNATNLRKAEYLAYRRLDKFNHRSVKRALGNVKSKGWIKREDLALTKEGKERLKNLSPKVFKKKKWDGNWYLVSYDIPEKKRRERGILRENIRRLGFGEMHASFWISPFNFLGEVERIVKEYYLSPFVILAISNKLGRRESKELATKIWKLDKINEEYKKLIKGTNNKSLENLVFEYFYILNKDPQLPEELLPYDWYGGKAHTIFKKYI